MRSKKFRSFYSNEANVYEKRRYQTRYGQVFTTLHHEVIRNLLQELPEDSEILEVACGTGHTTALLSGLGFKMTACDLTREMMEQAQQRVNDSPNQPKFLEADAAKLPFPDNCFDTVISTRFLHLFPMQEQAQFIHEMLRVLKPGGFILVDFDNWFSRWLFAIPYFIYNIIRYKRAAPYSIYNKVGKTKKMLNALGVEIDQIAGIGGTYLIVPALISNALAIRIGRLNKNLPGRLFAEQFTVFCHRSGGE